MRQNLKKILIISLVIVVCVLILINKLITPKVSDSPIPNQITPNQAKVTTPIPPKNPVVAKKSKYTDNNSNYLLIETNGYEIIYSAETDTYLISIINSPFDTYRAQVESELLESLNIDPESACQLNIQITTPRFANPDLAGQVFSPSFCL